jgi:hypothetical protein
VLSAQSAAFGTNPSTRNVTQALSAQGSDCLELMVRCAHRHQREIFWSMRMNDTHDVEHTPEKPYLLYPKLKMDRPECLVGNPVKRTVKPAGPWSGRGLPASCARMWLRASSGHRRMASTLRRNAQSESGVATFIQPSINFKVRSQCFDFARNELPIGNPR